MEQHAIVGKSFARVDAKEKVTGAAGYTRDINLPGMLYGKILRSHLPHAVIKGMNAEKARNLKGVRAIVTGQDSTGEKYGLGTIPMFADRDPLARDKVRFIGDGVAAVAAVDEDVAEEALDLIEVEYEERPAVFDPNDAMSHGAPAIHDYAEGNINFKQKRGFGDVEKGLREADFIREDTFSTQPVQHAALEPHAAIASWDNGDKLTLWASKQDLFFTHIGLSRTLGIPRSNIRIIKPHVGGGFGSKLEMFDLDFCAALLSRKCGNPVSICYTREEVFIASRVRHPSVIQFKTGMKKDGTISALDARIIMDTGAYAATGPVAAMLALHMLVTIYSIPNIRVEVYSVYTNKPVAAAMRGH
ncbi:MAG: molybdopterin cofactor-binding domain-containing protein, partial [Thermodesulfobacteriota bacterium]|nr:molybdopterin cofactor-binding domain-containing protein [Thermodesulfobacteriota bacterium]